jgi:hypothetical protein
MPTTTERNYEDPILAPLDLAEVFAGAEQWWEYDRDGRELVAARFFVRHPDYPGCTGLLSLTVETPEPGVLSLIPRRVITAEGDVPTEAVGQVTRYVGRQWEVIERRRGGPKPTPEIERIKIVKGWLAARGKVLQENYAAMWGVSARQLRRWRRELERQGKL